MRKQPCYDPSWSSVVRPVENGVIRARVNVGCGLRACFVSALSLVLDLLGQLRRHVYDCGDDRQESAYLRFCYSRPNCILDFMKQVDD